MFIVQNTVKKEAAEELLKYADTFTTAGYSALKKPQAEVPEALAPTLDHLENALGKFDGGPFLLGEFSLVSHLSRTRSLTLLFNLLLPKKIDF
ncbi:hypothetical protein SUGI_0689420 [Cryptomeria japonica]|nr:hypothetical protein SUGI_0689420 [Cryptomeria japonica]